MSLTLNLARRNLARNRRRTLLAGSFIALSLVALIFTDGFMRGMIETMVRNATLTLSGEAQVHASGYLDEPEVETVIKAVDALRQELDSREEIAAYTLRIQSPAMLGSSANALGVQLIGIEPGGELAVSRVADAVIQGRYLDGSKPTDILIGSRLAELLEVDLGDRLVLSVSMAHTGELNQQLYRLSGIVQFNNRPLDESMVFLPLGTSQQLLGLDDAIHQVAMVMADPALATDPAVTLWSELSIDGLDAKPWPKLMPELSSMLSYTDFALYIIGGILFVLAGLGVVNTMFMSIYERTYEFGVLRSIGTRAGAIARLIMTEALLLGLFSVLAGMILGGALEYLVGINGIQYGSDVEFNSVSLNEPIYPIFTWAQFTVIPLWVLGMTVVACLYPALYAARIVPAKALHKSL